MIQTPLFSAYQILFIVPPKVFVSRKYSQLICLVQSQRSIAIYQGRGSTHERFVHFCRLSYTSLECVLVTVVLGAQWGDEGKGKLVDILSAEVDVCARCAGGNNAGHTIVVPTGPKKVMKTYAFHLLPSGKYIFHKLLAVALTICIGLVNSACTGVIGSGVVVHLPSFFAELDALESEGMYIDISPFFKM